MYISLQEGDNQFDSSGQSSVSVSVLISFLPAKREREREKRKEEVRKLKWAAGTKKKRERFKKYFFVCSGIN